MSEIVSSSETRLSICQTTRREMPPADSHLLNRNLALPVNNWYHVTGSTFNLKTSAILSTVKCLDVPSPTMQFAGTRFELWSPMNVAKHCETLKQRLINEVYAL